MYALGPCYRVGVDGVGDTSAVKPLGVHASNGGGSGSSSRSGGSGRKEDARNTLMMRALPVLLSKLLSCTEFHFVCFEAAAAAASSGSSPSPLLFWPRLPLLPWPLLAALEASAPPFDPRVCGGGLRAPEER